jgi:hypothetical protein
MSIFYDIIIATKKERFMPEQTQYTSFYMSFEELAEKFLQYFNETRDRSMTGELTAADIGSLATQEGLDMIRRNSDEYRREIRNGVGRELMNALVDASLDGSKRASEFIYNLYLLSSIAQNRITNKDVNQTRLMVLFEGIKMGKLKNPELSYKYLKEIRRIATGEFGKAVMAEIAAHPLATTEDKCKNAQELTYGLLASGDVDYANQMSPKVHEMQIDAFQDIINQLTEKIENAIETHNAQALETLTEKDIPQLRYYLNEAIQRATGEYKATLAGMFDTLDVIFDLDKIFQFAEQGRNYVRETEQSIAEQLLEQSATVEQQNAEIEKLQAQLAEMQRQIAEKDKQMAEMTKKHEEEMDKQKQEHDEKVADLKAKNTSLELQKTALRSAVLLELETMEERANGGLIGVREDIKTEIAKLQKKLQEENGSIRI